MKLHEQVSGATNRITHHDETSLAVNGTRISVPCLLDATRLVAPWIPGLDALDGAALETLWPMEPRIVLLGHVAPDPTRWRELRALCAAHGAALEVMDVGAACRTFNVLVGEDRAVAALLFPQAG